MRRDISLELKSAETRERKSTIAFTISYRGTTPRPSPGYQHPRLLLHRGEPQGPREAGHWHRRIPENPARRGEGPARRPGAEGQRVQEAPPGRASPADRGQPRHARAAERSAPPEQRQPEQRDGQARRRVAPDRRGCARPVPGMPGAPEPAEQRLARLQLELPSSAHGSATSTRMSSARAEIAELERELAEPRPRPPSPTCRRSPPSTPRPGRGWQILRRRCRDQDAQGRGEAAPRRDRHLPAARPGHAATRAGVQGAGAGLRHDEGAVRLPAQAPRRGPARREHGAAPEGRAVPGPGPGHPRGEAGRARPPDAAAHGPRAAAGLRPARCSWRRRSTPRSRPWTTSGPSRPPRSW